MLGERITKLHSWLLLGFFQRDILRDFALVNENIQASVILTVAFV